jgi:hypothetical protein
MKELEPLTREQLQARVDDLCRRVKHGPRWQGRQPEMKLPNGTKIDIVDAYKLHDYAVSKHVQHAANLVGYAWGSVWPE